jgi:hydroxyacylglutathione hydrolase
MLVDNHEDIIAKAMRGQNIGKSTLAKMAAVERDEIEKLLEGEKMESVISKIAPILKLDTEKLLISAGKIWLPNQVGLEQVRSFESAFGTMTVNAYVVFEKSTRRAWIFDTGTECNSLVSFIEEENLKVDAIFLTHTHRDHIYCLDQLRSTLGYPIVYVHKSEQIQNTFPIDESFENSIGEISLKALHTHGHSIGGITYLISGLPTPLAIVGDALFAGSMGGGMVSYQDALRTNRDKIMTLPDETIICPGHGPMSSIAEEKRYNPFFPEF